MDGGAGGAMAFLGNECRACRLGMFRLLARGSLFMFYQLVQTGRNCLQVSGVQDRVQDLREPADG